MTAVREGARARPDGPGDEGQWRSLFLFNVSRTVIAAVLFALGLTTAGEPFGAGGSAQLYVLGSSLYLAGAIALFVLLHLRRPEPENQLLAQMLTDIVCVVLLMHAGGGIASGLGLLLLTSQAGAALVSRGRMLLFYASLASLAVLTEQTYRVLELRGSTTLFFQAGLMSAGYFAVAIVIRALANYAAVSERLARQRGIDLAKLAEVNELVIRDMQDGVIVVDEQGLIRHMNEQALALLGIERPSGSRRRLADVLPALAERVRAWQEGTVPESIQVRHEAGARQLGVRPVPVGGTRERAVIFLEDLSRIQREAQQLKLAALGRLTANVAHEIRNPLSSISHATELMLEETGTENVSERRLLQIVHENAQRIDRMVQEVLKLNRRDRVTREVFEVGAYLEGFAQQFCANEKQPAGLIRITQTGPAMVGFDRSHLNQVMWNLCRNALRYCSRGEGSISIRVAGGLPGERVRIDVIDDGPGVDPEARAHLFEPFFTTSSSGTGLGLYLARELCEANGAVLEYAEVALGTQFSVLCKGG